MRRRIHRKGSSLARGGNAVLSCLDSPLVLHNALAFDNVEGEEARHKREAAARAGEERLQLGLGLGLGLGFGLRLEGEEAREGSEATTRAGEERLV